MFIVPNHQPEQQIMPKIGRMNKSESQTVFDHLEMKHHIKEKDKSNLN